MTLDALVGLDYPAERFEVIVVDDDDDPAAAEVVERFSDSRVAVTYLSQREGSAAKARNAGARHAANELLVFVDDDVVPQTDHLHRHLAARAAHGDCLVNGEWWFPADLERAMNATPFGRYLVRLERWFQRELVRRPLSDGRSSLEVVTSCNLGVSRELFWKLGGFDEDFPHAGCEDQELGLRAREAGVPLIHDPAIKLVHHGTRVTLRQWCRRQETGAEGTVTLVAKHPEAYVRFPLIAENAPLVRADLGASAARKLAKLVLSRRPVLEVGFSIISALECTAVRESRLNRLYSTMIGLHLFRGVRRGFATLPDAEIAARRPLIARRSHAPRET